MFFFALCINIQLYGGIFVPIHGEETGLFRAVPLCFWQDSRSFLPVLWTVLHGKWGYPTPRNVILHPILHQKMPLYTGYLSVRCRKCRIFFIKLFFGECINGLPMGWNGPPETPDCCRIKHPNSWGKTEIKLYRIIFTTRKEHATRIYKTYLYSTPSNWHFKGIQGISCKFFR